MAPPTTTRADIRRAIGRTARLEFFMRYGNTGYINPTGTPTTDVVPCTDVLKQSADFWAGDWLYESTASEERIIISYDAAAHEMHLEHPFTTAPTATSIMEIWGMYPPSAVHQAINQAHRNSWKFFPNVHIVDNVIVCEDKLTYGLATSDLNGPDTDDDNPGVAEMLQIWIERSNNAVSGQFTSTDTVPTANTIHDTESSPDTAASTSAGYLISFYDGAGAGQLRELVSWGSDGDMVWDTEAETEPDTTTKYKIWHPAVGEQLEDWYKLTAARFDRIEYPDYLYLTQRYPGAYGLRMRFIYSAQTTDFAADTDVTYVPEEWLVWKSLAILHAGVVGDNRADRASEAGLASYYDELAEKFVSDNNWAQPAMTHWIEKDVTGYGYYSDQANPLSWAGQGP